MSSATAVELALFRRKELLRIVARDQLGIGVLSEITEELSNLADSILIRALEEVTRSFSARFGEPLEETDSKPARFTVLALGKLGGRELNYSSDIDLIFLYSGNGETSGPERITNKEFFKKIANQLTELLSAYTPAGQCYRVDLRLRPEGTHGEICIPLGAAKEYYSTRARGWELQALLKARVAAGDEQLGTSFSTRLRTWFTRLRSTSQRSRACRQRASGFGKDCQEATPARRDRHQTRARWYPRYRVFGAVPAASAWKSRGVGKRWRNATGARPPTSKRSAFEY